MSAVRGYQLGMQGIEGQILCAREFMNSLDESSLEEIKKAIRSVDWLDDYYEIGEKFIRSKDGRVRYVFAGLARNVDSIKSKSRLLLCWVDEAESVLETSWQKLIPTLREEGDDWQSELWVTWNPESKNSATHKRFREDTPSNSRIVEINWNDNPFFPGILERKRVEDKEKRPDDYEWIWEGGFRQQMAGAYYASHIAEARRENRIGRVARDPLLEVRAYWDIGGTGAKADATAIWLVQFVGKEIRWLDHYEAVGQPLEAHVQWLRSRGYPVPTCVLPHDGANHEKVFAVSYESSLRQAGFNVVVIPNQGRGAAKARIEALRRLFPSCWFNEETTSGGLDALGWYHEKRDDQRGIGLGPEHDWSSHSADAAGLVAVAHSAHREARKVPEYKPRKVV